MNVPGRSCRVLVVDDEPLIRWSVAETLADEGFQVVQSADAKGARAAFAHAHGAFDAVVLDLRLPDSADLSLLRALHAMAPSAALIVMTAHNTPDVVSEALDSGACCVLGKPFEVGDLARVVADAARQSPRPEVFPTTAN